MATKFYDFIIRMVDGGKFYNEKDWARGFFLKVGGGGGLYNAGE